MAVKSSAGSSVGQGGDNKIVPRMAVLLLMLLLVLQEATAVSVASHSAPQTRSLLESTATNSSKSFTVELMHVHHYKSPYLTRSLTLTERVRDSLASSMRTRLDSTYTLTSPLDTNHGSYIMEITVGTPPRTFLAIADTGSDLVWLQCSTCTNCLKIPDQPFDPSASSTYVLFSCEADACQDLGDISAAVAPCPTTDVCEYNVSYGDGSFTFGQLGSETFSLTSADDSSQALDLHDTAFGCGTDDESTTFRSTDGLVGLGQGDLSLVSQLGSLINYVFSYCLVDYSAAATVTSALLLGSPGAAAKFYTPLVINPLFDTFYFVNLLGITVNGQKVDFPTDTFAIDPLTGEGGIFLDSGTTITSLFSAAYVPFANAITSLVTYPAASSVLDVCYDTSSLSDPVFPKVVFQFDGLDVALSANNTFLLVDNAGTYCLAFEDAGPDAPFSIYGNVQQSNFEIAFDIGNAQIGFNSASLSCG